MIRHPWMTILAGIAAMLMGCAGPIKAYTFPRRDYQPSDYDVDASTEQGLLWGENTQISTEDNRSRRLGDIVVVAVQEAADASESASTDTSKDSSVTAGLDNFLGLIEKWASKHPDIDKSSLVKAVYNSSFSGSGSTQRKDSLNATIPCQVRRVLPNGDLFIEGGKTIQVNREETHLYLSGVVRPYDIDMTNTVPSGRVLDARIDFSGRGVISDKQGPGLGTRAVDSLWPF